MLTYFSLQEEQISSGKSYSDFSQSNFDCGRYKLLADINGNVNTDPVPNKDNIDDNVQEFIEEEEVDAVLELREDNTVDEDFVFYFTNENKADFFCGATQINDRYCLKENLKTLMENMCCTSQVDSCCCSLLQ